MDTRDPRTIRLYDIGPNQHIAISCGCCGRITHWKHGMLQRLNRLASDVLVYDLQFRVFCEHCRAREGFRITIETLNFKQSTINPVVAEIVVVEGKKPAAGCDRDFCRIKQSPQTVKTLVEEKPATKSRSADDSTARYPTQLSGKSNS